MRPGLTPGSMRPSVPGTGSTRPGGPSTARPSRVALLGLVVFVVTCSPILAATMTASGSSAAIPQAPAASVTTGGHSTAHPALRPAAASAVTPGMLQAGSIPGNSTARPGWWDVSADSTTALPVVEFTEGTWDATDGGVLFYGGDNYAANLNGTWIYDTGQWTEVSTHGNPGAISGGSLAYDDAAGYTVFYGGVTSFSPLAFNNSTYYYAHGNWTSHSLRGSPPVPIAGDMAYDPALSGVVLFGGANSSSPSTVLNQTWLFRNGSWSRLATPRAPPARWQAEMAFDTALDELVLYGGYDAGGTPLGDTWVFANGSWASVSASGLGVPAIGDGAMVYDPDLGLLVLTGGLDEFGNLQVGTWGFDGSAWSIVPTASSPHGHDFGIAAWDPLDHELVLAGGGGEGSPSFTDVLSIALSAVNITAPSATDVGVMTNFSASGIGGAPPYTFSWNWGDDTTNGTGSATHIYERPNSYVITLTIRGPSTNVATWVREITVVAGPVPSVAQSPPGLDAGTSARFVASVGGGVGPYRFGWSLSDGGTGSGAELNHTFVSAGDYVLNLTTLDSAGGTGSVLLEVVVNATPTVGIAPVNAPEAGAETVFQAAIVGGTPPFTYAWKFGGGGSSTIAGPQHRFSLAGPEYVNLTVTDADGATTSTNSSVDVVPGVAVSIQGPSTASAGSTATYTASVSDGSEPYKILWTLPSGAEDNGSTTSISFPGAGTFEVSVQVTDANGILATSSMNVTVQSTSSTLFGGTIGGIPTLALVVGVVIVGVVGVAAVVALRRRAPPPEPDQGAP
jgi:PKD repeat protein